MACLARYHPGFTTGLLAGFALYTGHLRPEIRSIQRRQMKGTGQDQRTGKEKGATLRQGTESISPECWQCITVWVISDTRDFSEKFPRAFIVRADLDECFRLVEWRQFSVILVLGGMAELEMVSQHEMKGFIYAIQICHCSVNSKLSSMKCHHRRTLFLMIIPNDFRELN